MSPHWFRSSAVARRLAALLVLTASLAPWLLAPAPAAAQGTMGMLPGPISTVELDAYAQRLRASPQQRRAMDAIHDQYKQEFRVLRDGEIAAFLKSMRAMEGSSIPKRKVIDDFVRDLDALGRKISAIDNRFFDQLQTTLTEEQLTMMPRVRLARQRGRMENMQMMWMGGERPTDLSEIVFSMDLSDADRAAASELLGPYESKLTADMEKMYAGTMKTITGIYDAMEKLGFSEESMQDPEQMEKISEAMQQVWMGMMAENTRQAAEVMSLNDRTLQSVTAAISTEASRTLRNRYHHLAYAEASFAIYPHDYVFAPALKRDDLTPEQREAVIAARDQMLRTLDSVLDRAIAEIRQWRGSVSAFEYDQAKAEAYQKKMVDMRADADKARADANASLEAALGKELLDKVGRLKTSYEEPQEEMAGAAEDIGGDMAQSVEVEPASEDMTEVAMGIDQFVPPAIAETDLQEYGDLLGLNEEQRGILRELHERYMTEFKSLGEKEFAALQRATANMWRFDEQTQTTQGPTLESVNETYKLRAVALEAVRKADEALFSEMELALASPERAAAMARVRTSRERSIYNRASYYWDDMESSLDVARLVQRRRSSISASEWPNVDAALQEYEKAALPLFKTRFAKAMDVQKAQELWQAEYTRMTAEGDANNVKMGLRYQEMMREPQEALGEASRSLSTLNRGTIDSIAAMLSGEAGGSLRAEYNRRAFPNVYGDEGAMEAPITRARALPDLTDEQARQLTDLAAQYHPAYALLCEDMIKSSGGRSNMWATIDEDNANEWQQREEALAKLRFDRSELNARAAGQLKAILTEDQLKRIGGLPNVEKPTEFDF